jgi:hypothetical protein
VQSVFDTAMNMLRGLHGDTELWGIEGAVMELQAGGKIIHPREMPDYKLNPFIQGYADAVDRLSRG